MADATIIGKVAIKLVPDTEDFRGDAESDLNAIEALLGKIKIGFEARKSEAVDEVDDAIDQAQRKARTKSIKIRVNMDDEKSVQAGIARIRSELDKLSADEIKVKLNQQALNALRQELISVDDQMFEDMQKRVSRAFTNAMSKVPFNPEIRDEDIDRLKTDIHDKLEARDALKLQLEAGLSDRERAKVERELSELEAEVAVKVNELSFRTTQIRLVAVTRPRIVDIYPEVNQAAAAKAAATLAALTGGRGVGNVIDDFADSIGKLDENALTIGGISLALAKLSSLALVATSNVASLSGSLASMAGASLALPGIMGGLAIGFGATIAVLKDFNQVLPDVGDRFGALQDRMSDTFYDRAAAPFESFIDTIFPQFAAGMDDTSAALGTFFANLASDSEGVLNGALGSMFDDLGQSILVAGDYTDSFIGIIQKLGAVGAGNLPSLAEYVGELMEKFDGWLGDKGPAGLQEFIDNGTRALRDFGGVLSATGSLLAGLARAAENAGGSTLASLRSTMERAADAVNGAGFQRAFSGALRAGHEGMDELSNAIGEDFSGIMVRLSSTLSRVLPTAGRAVGTLLSGLFKGLNTQNVENTLVGLFDNLEASVNNLAPTLDGLIEGLAGIVDVAGALAESITGTLAPIFDKLGPQVGDVADELVPFIELLGDVARVVSTVLSTALSLIPPKAIVLGAALIGINIAAGKVSRAVGLLKFSFDSARNGAVMLTNGLNPLQRQLVAAGMAAGNAQTAIQRFANGGIAGMARGAGKAAVAVGGLALATSGALDKVGLTNTLMLGMAGSTFGPWGAAIGTATGLVLDFRAESKRAEAAVRAFGDAVADPNSSLDELTAGLSTTITELESYSNLSEEMAGSLGGYFKGLTSTEGWGALADAIDGTNDKLLENQAVSRDATNGVSNLMGVLRNVSDLAGGGLGDNGTLADFFNAEDMQKVQDAYGRGDLVRALQLMGPAIAQVQPGLDDMGISLSSLLDNNYEGLDFSQELFDNLSALNSTQGRIDAFATEVGRLDDTALGAKVSADALASSLDALLSPTLNAEQATDAWHESLRALGEQLAGNQAGFRGYSEAALGNRAATREATTSLQEYLVRQAEAGASSSRIARLVMQARQAFIDEGVAAGRSGVAMEARANKIGLTPKLVTTVFRAAGIDLTNAQLRRLLGQMDKLPRQLRTYITNRGVPESMREINRLDKRLDLTAKERKILISLLGDREVTGKVDRTRRTVERFAKGKFQADITATNAPAESAVGKARKNLQDYAKINAKATVSIVDNATGKISAIRADLNSLDGKTSTVTVNHRTFYSSSRKGGGPAGGNGKVSGEIVPNGKVIADQVSRVFKDNLVGKAVQFNAETVATNALNALSRTISFKLAEQVKRQQTQMLTSYRNLLKKADKERDKILKNRYSKRLELLEVRVVNHDRAMRELTTLRDRLSQYREELRAFKEQVQSSFASIADPTAMEAFTYEGIVNGLNQSLEKAKRFQTAIRGLIKAGLNKTTLQQLMAAGPERGLAAAELILKGGVDKVDDIVGQINDIGKDVAIDAGNGLFGDLITGTKTEIDALVKELRPMQRRLRELARELMEAFREELRAGARPPRNENRNNTNRRTTARPIVAPRKAVATTAMPQSAVSGEYGTVKVLNYYAAPNQSIESEESLFDALNKAGAWL